MIEQAVSFEARGYSGCEAAVKHDETDSAITPFLLWCWLKMVVKGLRRVHWLLSVQYDLRGVQSGQGRRGLKEEAVGYQRAIAAGGQAGWPDKLEGLPMVYQARGHFFYGNPSQQRLSRGR
jgi:hypothetical protein